MVAPAAGGLLDLVRDGETGVLCPPGEPEALRDAVAALVGDPVRREEMGRRAQASVAGRSWEALGDQLLGHYAAVRDPSAEQEAVA